MTPFKLIKSLLSDHIQICQDILKDDNIVNQMKHISDIMSKCIRNGGKILFCGNGGSAADAQHLAAELTGKFLLDRDPVFAEALHVNSSYLTAVSNDYGYNKAFARAIKAKGCENDVLVAISTSGNSENIINAMEQANQMAMITVGFTGESGGKMKDKCDHLLMIPSNQTPRIQEVHILAGHIIIQLVEEKLFSTP